MGVFVDGCDTARWSGAVGRFNCAGSNSRWTRAILLMSVVAGGKGAKARDAERLLEQHLPIEITIFSVLLLHGHRDLQAGSDALLTP